jgi:glucose-6-phosphate 1-dehydrogenase
MVAPASTAADVLVIFGITGDLAKKMTFPALYRLERRRMLQCPVIGVARGEWSAATLRDHARHAIEDGGEEIDEDVFRRFAERLSMVPGDYGDAKTYDRLARAIAAYHTPVFYLETPPWLFSQVIEGLARANLTSRARVVVEKPFGHDLASARTLNAELLGLFAAEPPTAADADGLRDKRVEVFRAMPPADPNRYVRGQYNGYLAVPGVSAGSATETFVALRLEIDNWRWAGVPFFIRAGKLLRERVTEIRVIFKRPPKLAFAPTFTPDPNELILRIDPDPGVDLVVQVKQPRAQATRTADLSLIFSEELGKAPQPYERLLGDALQGDPSLFTREDSVEETWRIVQPLLDAPPQVERYKPGSWGPASADRLLAGHPSWRDPWLHSHATRLHRLPLGAPAWADLQWFPS